MGPVSLKVYDKFGLILRIETSGPSRKVLKYIL
jgi:hypothetical protein